MAIYNSHEIRQVNMVFIINTVNGVLLDYVVTSHMFSEWYLFSLYHPLTNDKYIIIDGHYHVLVVGIGSVTLIMILPNSTSKLIFINTLHIPTLGADLISLGVFHHNGALV